MQPHEEPLVAAADIGGTRLRLSLARASGERLASSALLLPASGKTPEAVCSLIAEALDELCAQAEVARDRVRHLVAGVPGITDVREGVVLAAPNLDGWTRLPLRALLERTLWIGATVENDTNLAALGEYAAYGEEAPQSLVFVAVGTGVGSGIVLGGRIHHGAHWLAGEVGYLSTGKERRPLDADRTGALEEAAGGDGIAALWQRLLREKGADAADPRMMERSGEIFARAAQGEAAAVRCVEATARLLAGAVVDVALVLDPEVVVLGGGVGASPVLLAAVERQLVQHAFPLPQLRLSTLGTEAQLAGGVLLARRALGLSGA